jgi:Xaa-Pro aminopeptidase
MTHDLEARKARQAKVLRELRLRGQSALLITHLADIRYLCGFTGSSAVLMLARDAGAVFFTDGRYTEQAQVEVQGAAEIVIEGNPLVRALAWARKNKLRRIGLDFTHLSVASFHEVRRTLARRSRLVDCSGVIEGLRMIKDADEISRIRKAVNLGASLFPVALRSMRPGISESQVAAEMEYEARRRGGEGMSFDTIVAGGPRSALPHGRASREPLPQRGFVVVDFGVILTGYCSDMTRTVHLGKAEARERRMYDAVLRAQRTAIGKVRPGVAVSAVDAAARETLERAGYGKFFTHSTGHGVGLEIHEPPRIAGKQRQKLRAGMVITVEPGIYIPNEGGVRIEDMVLVTEGGCEILTPTTKKLITI